MSTESKTTPTTCPFNHGAATTTTTTGNPDNSHNVGGQGTSSDFHTTGSKHSNRPGRGGFPVMYHSYLQLDKILNSHTLMSARRTNATTGQVESKGFGPKGEGAHDEHLFITIHQTYELWFKQMMFELDDVVRMFQQDNIPEANIGIACRRLKRVTEIQRVLLDQLVGSLFLCGGVFGGGRCVAFLCSLSFLSSTVLGPTRFPPTPTPVPRHRQCTDVSFCFSCLGGRWCWKR
jgi:hypothetical protein